jgi:hypothetical protein
MWRCFWRQEEEEEEKGAPRLMEAGVEMENARRVAQTRLLLMGWEGRARVPSLHRRRSKVTGADQCQL